MATTGNKNVKDKEQDSIMENPEVLQEKLIKTEDFLEKNKNVVIGAAVAIVLVIAGVFGYSSYIKSQDDEAQKEMFQAVYYFEADSLNKALKGDGNNRGLLDIIDDYGRTKAGNLAKFYVGNIYLKQAKYQEAADILKDFSASDILIQARAYSLAGDAYMELGDKSEAIRYYKKAIDHRPNKYYTPRYMMKLALAQELNDDAQAALATYTQLLEKYFDAAEANDAKKFKAKLEQQLASE
jgi:predicted negative regulator of RcsB-dependent stress response